MSDLLYVAAAFAFFALCAWYVSGLDRLEGRRSHE